MAVSSSATPSIFCTACSPNWHNALGQLLSFLAYDLVLIVPFVGLLNTVEPGRYISLIIYTAVLVYSGGLAVYYLFINPHTRFGT